MKTPIFSAFKKIQPRANPPEADPNLPKCPIPRQKINIGNLRLTRTEKAMPYL
jgi:hypothetical protein